MSDHIKGQSTGPKTVDGKAVSSQNARKDSIFVQGYLPWENIDEKQQQFLAMTRQWNAKDPSRQMLLRSIEQCHLGIERMMYIERKKIQGLMQSTTIAYQFCERAGLSEKIAHALPSWFFLEDGESEKQRAVKVAHIYDETAEFKARYSDQLAARVKDVYPALFTYVMHSQKEGASFLMTLGQRYKESAVTLNLGALMNELKERWEFHFIWAQEPARYQTIIDGLRAEQMEQAIDLDKSQRYATNLQNRMLKGFLALAALDQHELLMKNQQQIAAQLENASNPVLEMAPKESATKKPDSGQK
ncbi:hypothetical protein AOC23_07560 [Polynucleobacter paneuropaeus]|jgi:hypothetical protein|uniref:hypothetical protein n=1 Tax=Polynucleobacter paneuropaeus TaxID=2527775 RepID=UPI001BFD5E53|nr:hypothetical protein [Polynucleobacter paneuropaeus]MBT8631923.1 hypothetical protein [Polynucleobacter paneuropaeus]